MRHTVKIDNLRRIKSKKVQIRKFLELLDEGNVLDPDILYELFLLYSCSNKKFMAFSFAEMIKDKYPDANEYVVNMNEIGNVPLPIVTKTNDLENDLDNTIVIVSNSSFFSVLLNCI